MSKWDWIEPVIFFALMFAVTTIIAGFIINVSEATVGHSDKDCSGPPPGHPHDEAERDLNGCIKHCETHPVWYRWGNDQDCYWDDE